MASPANTTRRTLFAIAAGAAAFLPIPAMASATDNGSRLLQLERLRATALARLDVPNLTEAQVDEEADKCAVYELEIAAAPCDSRDAMLVKLRTVVRTGMVYGQLEAVDEEALIDGIIAFAEGVH